MYTSAFTVACQVLIPTIIVHSKDGNLHPSAQDLHDIQLTAAMIPQNDGERLIDALQSKSTLKGKFVPIGCNQHMHKNGATYCEPVRFTDSIFVDSIDYGGTIELSNGESSPYTHAEFGAHINDGNWSVINVDGGDFCSKIVDVDPNMAKGKAILVARGGCSFADKARHVADLGADLMLLVNDDDSVMGMGVDADYEGSKIRVASIMISKSAGESIASLLEDDLETVVSISVHRDD